MINETNFGIGFAGTIAMHFETLIVSIISFFAQAIKLFLTFTFRWLIVDLFLDCIPFSSPVRIWFWKRRRKPPDKLLCSSSSLRMRNPSLSQFRFWWPVDCCIGFLSSFPVPIKPLSFASSLNPFGTLRLLNVNTKTHFENATVSKAPGSFEFAWNISKRGRRDENIWRRGRNQLQSSFKSIRTNCIRTTSIVLNAARSAAITQTESILSFCIGKRWRRNTGQDLYIYHVIYP